MDNKNNNDNKKPQFPEVSSVVKRPRRMTANLGRGRRLINPTESEKYVKSRFFQTISGFKYRRAKNNPRFINYD
jgi:hypothetical protein